jgi:3-deoxy-D-manno-octulosonic acid kinase
MTLAMCPQTRVIDGNHIVFDPKVLSNPCPELFSCDTLAERGLVTGWALGRGAACFFRWQEQDWVLRHFRRGGVIAHIVKDMYLGCSVKATRSWKEWQLLAALFSQGLPVPRPVAARAVMNRGWYRADLITVRIPDSMSLSTCLQRTPLPQEVWCSIGACVRKFHDFGVYHADLNAHNILLDKEDKVYLIDFDQCRLCSSGADWKHSNLKRLQRSLKKIRERQGKFFFGSSEWEHLVRGYLGKENLHYE